MKHITTLLLALQFGLLAGLAQIVEPIYVTYQGTVSSNGVPVNGPHDVVLSLWAGPVGGAQIGASVTNASVQVTNGQFAALIEPWSPDDFSSTNLHLQIALRRSGSGQPYVTMSPRQRLTSVPRAVVADKAMTISPAALSVISLGTNGVDGAIIAPGSLSGEKFAPASVVKSLNGLKDGVILQAADDIELTTIGNTITLKSGAPNCSKYTNCYWNLLGNGNIVPHVNFLGGVAGELDPVEFRVNNTHVMRYEVAGYSGSPSTPNIIGGDEHNSILVGRGSVIGGGGHEGLPNVMDNGHWGVIAGGVGNRITNQYGVIGGGLRNGIHGSSDPFAGWYSGIAFGFLNQIASGTGATISGGQYNSVSADNATTAGGAFNTNSGSSSVIGGGDHNLIPAGADRSTVAGGHANIGSGPTATVGGGAFNVASGAYSTVSGGQTNIASAIYATISGGFSNLASGISSTLSGGETNLASGDYATVGGGRDNEASGRNATSSGGVRNLASGNSTSIGGGSSNSATANFSTIGGGATNLAAGQYSTIPGGHRARANSYGQQAYASGQFASIGDAQSSLFVLRTNTSSTAQAELLLDGGTAGNQRMIVPNNATWTFNILVVARSTTAGSESGGWEIRGVVQKIGATVSLLCSTITTNCATLVGTPFVVADSPNSALSIRVKDQTAASTRWVASVRTAEVNNP